MSVSDPLLEVADRVARAVREGSPADRAPTVAQLLRAFGEADDTREARERVARALALAGVAVTRGLADAPAGSRVALEARAAGRRLWPWLLALLALAGLSAVLVTQTGTEATTRTVVRAPPAVTVAAATTATSARPSAAERRRARRARAARAAARRAGARRRRARAPVTVRVSPAAPTFLCVEDGAGRRLSSGTLTGPRTFRARVVRLNVGLASTGVRADGRPVALSGSPTGVRITRRGSAYLPLGSRPCA